MTAKDLKNALLQEAVQGKLVLQIASEGNARDLLNEIKRQKAKLIADGKIKKEKPLPEITDDEIPFDIPENWCWCRLGEIIIFIGGYAYDSHSFCTKSKNQVLRLGNVKNGNLVLTNTPVFISDELANRTDSFRCKTNDILITMTGTRLKRDYFYSYLVLENDCNLFINQRVGCLRPLNLFCASYLTYCLKSKNVLDYIFQFETGTANQGNLGATNILNIPIPLPPLAEQKRIVAKLEELLPKVEEYGVAQEGLDKLNKEFPEKLKKSILQEAVQGKLVPQDAKEGSGTDLLKQIQVEKAQLIKEGKLKKEKPLPEITDEEIPFDIPENWCWCRWGDLSESIQYGFNAPAKGKGRIRMVRISDIQDNEVMWNSVPFCDIEESEIPTYILRKNDILFARTGGTVGKSFLVKDVPYESVYAGYLIRTRYSENLVPQYLKFFMESQLYWEQLKNGTIATAQPNCNGQTLSKMLLPLPPLSEQKRIVAKLEVLLGEVEKLKR